MNRALLDCESLGRESSGETIQPRLLCKTAARTQKAQKSTEKWKRNGLKYSQAGKPISKKELLIQKTT